MQLIARLTSARFVRFVGVGLAGFIVDAGFLVGLMGWGLNPFWARAISFTLAALCAWRLNRAITFGAEDGPQLQQGARYGLIALIAGGVNYLVYAALVLAFGTGWALPALVAATAVSMLVSYTGMARLVFR